jgi:carboxyl-terminal processing protease
MTLGRPAFAQPGFDAGLTVDVVATGLAFIAPRTLEQVSLPQLALWGLQGFSALDPSLFAGERDGQLVVDQGARRLAAQKMPGEDDALGWGQAVARFGAAAVTASPAVAAAGTGGVISAFFTEVFDRMDPYSRYVPPAPDGSGPAREEAGIGAELAGRPGAVSVVRLKADGPADIAGVQIGERILQVDGEPTAGQTATILRTWLAGPEGTTVDLILARPGAKPREVKIERRIVPPETVFIDRRGGVMMIRITAFARDTDTRLEEELGKAFAPDNAHPPSAMIFDLRDNRGGLLRQAVLAADSVLSSGVVVTTVGRDPEASVVWHARPDDITAGVPIVVLVDGGTASAAEILAAGLQDHGRAVVVGSATLGKGLVQAVAVLPNGGELYVSWSRVIAPAGFPLQSLGVLPQVCTSLGEATVTKEMRALANGDLLMEPALRRQAAMRAPVAMNRVLDVRSACPAAQGSELDMRTALRLLGNAELYEAARFAPVLPPQ